MDATGSRERSLNVRKIIIIVSCIGLMILAALVLVSCDQTSLSAGDEQQIDKTSTAPNTAQATADAGPESNIGKYCYIDALSR